MRSDRPTFSHGQPKQSSRILSKDSVEPTREAVPLLNTPLPRLRTRFFTTKLFGEFLRFEVCLQQRLGFQSQISIAAYGTPLVSGRSGYFFLKALLNIARYSYVKVANRIGSKRDYRWSQAEKSLLPRMEKGTGAER